jgi:hypothetical protein
MHYMLIQDGLRRSSPDALRYRAPSSLPTSATSCRRRSIDGVQTVDILANGRLGVFHEIDAAGNPCALPLRAPLLADARA